MNGIVIRNKKAFFDYHIIARYDAGLVLTGAEVKTLRMHRVSFTGAFCCFDKGELFVKEMTIPVNVHEMHFNCEPTRDKKLLLTKKELCTLKRAVEKPGLTIVPLSIHTNQKGLFKIEIGLAKGKKIYDKRASLKEADIKREIQENLGERL